MGLILFKFKRMKIREFTNKDIESITLLMKNLCQLRGQEFDEERWRVSLNEQMSRNSNTDIIVALDDETNLILGMGNCSIMTSENGLRFGYITNLIVKEENRRLGIGEQLLHHMIDYLKRNHITSIRLALKENSDKIAQILFTKLGFQEVLHIYELKI
jgi:ribosomal protein S18 acetylase RimI-like enzyme